MKRIAPVASPPWPRPQLECRDLELALALAAAGSTAGAAASMHLTQSAVSRALALAEARVGVRLFDRTARGVSPTAAGERLVAGAGVLLAQLRELERQVAAPVAAPTRLRLVCECYTAYRWLPSAMATLQQRLPGLVVDVRVEHTGDPVNALLDGSIDVALLTTSTLPRSSRGELVDHPLLADEVIFLLSSSHPLAARASLRRDDLRAHRLLTSNTPPAEARWFLATVFGRQRPRLEFVRMPLTEAIVDAARAGLGVAVLSEWMASGYLGAGDLVVRRLSSGPLRRPWRIAYRRDVTDAATSLVGALQAAAPRLSS